MNRRNFLQAATATALSLSTLEALARKGKPVGLQLYTLRNQIDSLGIEKVLAEVARLGYKNIEHFGYGDRRFFGKTANEFKLLLNANGLAAPSGHYLTGFSQAMKMPGLSSQLDAALEDAVALGQKYMMVSYLFPDERTPDHYKRLADLLNSNGEKVARAGLKLGYHNHDFEFSEKMEDGTRPYDFILKNTSAPLELDLYWVTRAGQSPLELFRQHPGRFPLWHVKDMARTEKKEFAEVGTGSIDFAAIFAQAKQAGLRYYFVEQDESNDPMASVKTSVGNIQKAKWGW